MEMVGTIIGIILLFVITLFIIGYSIIISNIKKYSKLFIELTKVNDKYNPLFHKVQKKYHTYFRCNSLQKFRNNNNEMSILNYLCGYMRENEAQWQDLYDKTNSNKDNLKKYIDEYEVNKNFHAGKSYTEVKRKTFLTEEQYKKYEEKVCKKNLLKPITNIDIITHISYSSPKGRNHYSAKWNTDIDRVFFRIKERKRTEQSIEYQRTLMTNSKRYDILKRDNFKCQICGRTQDDGAKLEVDHKIPVSKGGKTVDSNLQTLCYECNQGKKAKI